MIRLARVSWGLSLSLSLSWFSCIWQQLGWDLGWEMISDLASQRLSGLSVVMNSEGHELDQQEEASLAGWHMPAERGA